MKNSIAIAVISCFCLSIPFVHATPSNTPVAEQLLTERLSTLNTQVDLRLTNLTKKKIEEYINYKRGAKRLITKSKVYFPIFEAQLKKYNVPEEFKYLPVIESNLRVNIKSRAGAVGLWQFMKRTGQSFGLQIGAEVDERMDVAKSSEAAAQYLNQLYNEFQDWTLVLVAYNAGAGGIRKAIRKSGSRNYWAVYEHLPRETRSYLPKFAAAAYLMNFHHAHDIVAPAPKVSMTSAISAKIFQELDFETIAESSNTPIEVVASLNAQYFKGFIPSSNGRYLLRLPADNMNQFLQNNRSAAIDLANLPASFQKKALNLSTLGKNRASKLIASKRKVSSDLVKSNTELVDYELIKLGKKETLSILAAKVGLSLNTLMDINGIDMDSNNFFNKYIKVPTDRSLVLAGLR